MENKRVVMLVTMMIVMAMGNLVIQTEAQASQFRDCYPICLVNCAAEKKFPTALTCPFTCIMTCLAPPATTPSPPSPMTLANEIDHIDYFCKLGCATHHCVSLSSFRNRNVDKVADCVDSCSDKCSNKN
ncbi:unnamed protein product [Microthlaspi erraticum]|uniref:Thionin-like protein 2 n=1 Tax=Microthlaspi erraticum TaxID=1685480 RepID=A0A6D2J7P2_9BRAS|nr:unnamed protein product [Microthlaspi erraticum]